MLLAGIWFSKEKPLMNVFLRPIIDEINEIYSKGYPFMF
jgi:5-methylcytosine-specific restriction endonuclease McrBC regulatory subunit McrC